MVPRLSNPDPGKDFLGREALSERSLGRSEEKQRGGEMEGRAQEGGTSAKCQLLSEPPEHFAPNFVHKQDTYF